MNLPCSLYRYERARRLLTGDRGHINTDSFKKIFQDHFSYPESICRHVTPENDYAHQLCTVQSVILDMEERSLYIAEGPPCRSQYTKLSPEILR